jgi:hypothetical protein
MWKKVSLLTIIPFPGKIRIFLYRFFYYLHMNTGGSGGRGEAGLFPFSFASGKERNIKAALFGLWGLIHVLYSTYSALIFKKYFMYHGKTFFCLSSHVAPNSKHGSIFRSLLYFARLLYNKPRFTLIQQHICSKIRACNRVKEQLKKSLKLKKFEDFS